MKPARTVCKGLTRLSVLAAVASAACGGPSSNVKQPDLAREVALLRAQARSQQDRLEEMSNRLFVLADRLDTLRSEPEASAIPSTLEVVRLQPSSKPASLEPPPPAEALDEGFSHEEPVVIRLGGNGELEVAAPHESESRAVRDRPQANPEQIFRDALGAYREGRVQVAFERFSGFVKRYGKHPYVDNALYWMGECRYDAKEYSGAIRKFVDVVERFPRSNKIPDALLKIGLAYERLGEQTMAKKAFEDLLAGYPKSAVADLARVHLQRAQAVGGTP